MPDWPATLPQTPPLEGIQIGGPSGAFVEHQMDAGPPQTRRRSTAVRRPATFTYQHLTQTQIEVFEDWFENDLVSGTLTFTMPHPITDLDRTWKFINPASPYSISPMTRTTYQLTISLELLP